MVPMEISGAGFHCTILSLQWVYLQTYTFLAGLVTEVLAQYGNAYLPLRVKYNLCGT